MNDLVVFNSEEFGEVRTVMVDNEVWFVAKDVCICLDVNNTSQALTRLDDDERDVILNDTHGGLQKISIVNEGGLYSLILSSRKKEARLFKKWITSEVLPSIRKTGSYSVLPKTYLQALKELVVAVEEKERLQIENNELKPKAIFFDTVADSKTAIDMGRIAKVVGIMGRNKMFKFLREKNILMNNNVPFQEFVDRGYFRVLEQKYTGKDGQPKISVKTLVYQKGVDYIIKQLKKDGYENNQNNA